MIDRPIISFDIDGVVAGGNYIPEWDRRPEIYKELPILDERARDVIYNLSWKYNIYFVSSRKFPNALRTSVDWLYGRGFNPSSRCCGVICYGKTPLEKPLILSALGSRLHFDDHPGIVAGYSGRAALFINDREVDSQWPGTDYWVDSGKVPVVRGWGEVEGFVEEWFEGEWLEPQKRFKFEDAIIVK